MAILTVSGFNFFGSSSTFINARQFGIVDVHHSTFSVNNGGTALNADQGSVSIVGPITINGNQTVFASAGNGGQINFAGAAVSMPVGGIAITYFVLASNGGRIYSGAATFTGPGSGTGTTGTQANVAYAGSLITA